jgi:hypothetical protein
MAAAIKPVELQLGNTLRADQALEIFGYTHRDKLTELRQSDDLIRGVHFVDPNPYHIIYFERPCRNFVANWCDRPAHLRWIEEVLLKGK